MNVSHKRSGFTLVELLTAMGILVVIVLMMSRIFTETTRMWTLGTKRVFEAQEARAVMDFMTQGLSSAVADDVISFKMHSVVNPNSLSRSVYGEDTDSIAFIAYTQTPPWGGRNIAPGLHVNDPNRQVRRRSTSHFIYYVDYMRDENNEDMDASHPEGPRYRLMRRRATQAAHNPIRPAGQPLAPLQRSAQYRQDWWTPEHVNARNDSAEEVAMNVVAFELWAYTASGNYVFNFDSSTIGEPPLWVDVYFEVMGEAEVARLALMWQQNHPDFFDYRERNARRYSTRVFLRNWQGYNL